MGNPKTEQRVGEDEVPVRTFMGQVLANPAYHCKGVDLWPNEIKELSEEHIAGLDAYLERFSRPVRTIADEIRCVACDFQVTGAHVGLQDWRHKTALTYSTEGTCEGRCNQCGYPVRLFHEIRSLNGERLLVRLNGFPLFYHPNHTAQIN
jgi:hypothetical protein